MGISISQSLTKAAISLRWESIPQEVIQEAKRAFLDTLACAYAGYEGAACQIMRVWALETGGRKESSIWGMGSKIPTPNAALVNGTMVRYSELNDTYTKAAAIGTGGDSSVHSSENIPALVAVAEKIEGSGKDLLMSIIVSYELGARICDSLLTTSLPQKGFNHTTIGFLTIPVSVGVLMNLAEDKIVNAIGIAGTQLTLGIVDAMPNEMNTMVKNVAHPITGDLGVKACLWAAKGFTGPLRIFEGHKGLIFSALGQDFDGKGLRNSLSIPLNRYAITETRRKLFSAENSCQGILEAARILADKIRPEEIQTIIVRGSTRCISHLSDPDRFYLLNKETADHSLPFLMAMLFLEGDISPEQFTPEKINSSAAKNLLQKVQLETDSSMDNLINAGEVKIKSTDGRVLKSRVDFPKGSPENPLTDEEVIAKFQRFAGRYLEELHIEEIIEKVYQIEEIDNLCEFTPLLAVKD